jgi:hypothetical protein
MLAGQSGRPLALLVSDESCSTLARRSWPGAETGSKRGASIYRVSQTIPIDCSAAPEASRSLLLRLGLPVFAVPTSPLASHRRRQAKHSVHGPIDAWWIERQRLDAPALLAWAGWSADGVRSVAEGLARHPRRGVLLRLVPASPTADTDPPSFAHISRADKASRKPMIEYAAWSRGALSASSALGSEAEYLHRRKVRLLTFWVTA